MESDAEWIIEKEDPCLPNDVSWMDVNESFTLEEGARSNKRNKGPRNLTTKVDRKGKSIVIANNNEIDDIIED